MVGFVPLSLRSWSAAVACAASLSFHAGSSDAIRLGLRLTFQRNGDSEWQVQPLCFMKWPLALRSGFDFVVMEDSSFVCVADFAAFYPYLLSGFCPSHMPSSVV